MSCFKGIQIRFTVDNYTTSWQKVEKGIDTGCTMSPILFIISMGMVIRTEGERERETSCLRRRMYSNFNYQSEVGRPYDDNNDPYTGKMDTISVNRCQFMERRSHQ